MPAMPRGGPAGASDGPPGGVRVLPGEESGAQAENPHTPRARASSPRTPWLIEVERSKHKRRSHVKFPSTWNPARALCR